MIPHARDAEMLKHIQSWQSSGETQTSYCQRHSIATHQFIYYKRKLGYMKPDKLSKPTGNQLVPVTIKPEVSREQPLWIEHQSGFRVQYHAEADEQQVLQALKLVKQVT